MLSVNLTNTQPKRVERARAVPTSRPYYVAAILFSCFVLCLVGAVTSIWFAVADSNQEALHLFLMFMSLSLIFWLMSYIKRKHTICTLCKGTPLLNSGSLVHVRAKRLPPLNHGTTALASIIFSQKYRCMFCGEDYDLLKKKHRHY